MDNYYPLNPNIYVCQSLGIIFIRCLLLYFQKAAEARMAQMMMQMHARDQVMHHNVAVYITVRRLIKILTYKLNADMIYIKLCRFIMNIEFFFFFSFPFQR